MVRFILLKSHPCTQNALEFKTWVVRRLNERNCAVRSYPVLSRMKIVKEFSVIGAKARMTSHTASSLSSLLISIAASETRRDEARRDEEGVDNRSLLESQVMRTAADVGVPSLTRLAFSRLERCHHREQARTNVDVCVSGCITQWTFSKSLPIMLP